MLLFSRRFLPFFITQFFGAFTDNLYKNALLVYLTLHLTDSQTLSLYASSGWKYSSWRSAFSPSCSTSSR